MFLTEVSYARYIYLTKSHNSNILKYYYNWILLEFFLWRKAEFSVVIFQIIMICWFSAQETFLIIIMLITVQFNIFVVTIYFTFLGILEQQKQILLTWLFYTAYYLNK